MRRKSIFAMLAMVSLYSIPTPALAQSYPDVDTYASQQCGNGRWDYLGYGDYDQCYAAAVNYYYQQTGGGGPVGGDGGGGGGGSGGGTFIGDIPGYNGNNGCTAKTRLCDSGQDPS
ncbi:hypothetical protein [Sphingomonas alpina]|uniref:Uncharacterized protein n=1 Tax=Sphingomonas alpina TaxID=653931 RepID=A0A7H0LMD7_9SPHN|nr:hypothetical protein [Sphingomonas alpina]QNQ10840.1 hypothetical protein H3Z74_06540 [Sphingomonas alpina]